MVSSVVVIANMYALSEIAPPISAWCSTMKANSPIWDKNIPAENAVLEWNLKYVNKITTIKNFMATTKTAKSTASGSIETISEK